VYYFQESLFIPTSYFKNVECLSTHHLCSVLYFFEVRFNPSTLAFYDREHTLHTGLFANTYELSVSGFPVFPVLFLTCLERRLDTFQLTSTEKVQNFQLQRTY
jgi:hypothetical protein